MMKVVSAILTAFLLLPIVACSLRVYSFYYKLKSSFIPDDIIGDMAKPYIIVGITLIVSMLILIYLNVKRNYTVSVIISSGLILAYLILVNFINSQ